MSRRGVTWGVAADALLASFYVAVLAGCAGWNHGDGHGGHHREGTLTFPTRWRVPSLLRRGP